MQNILMIDSISRKAAIDAFYQYPNVNWITLDVMEKIKELPSAQQWTPVSEKPIPKGLVFVTYNDGDVDLLSQPTSYRRGDIVAWMPSPESWKGDNNEYTN